ELSAIRDTGTLYLLDREPIPFNEAEHLLFHRHRMYPDPAVHTHPNGMRFTAFDEKNNIIAQEIFYSVGGGFILSAEEVAGKQTTTTRNVPYPFRSAAELLSVAAKEHLTIAELLLANEVALLSDDAIHRPRPLEGPSIATPEDQINASIFTIWRTMQQCT